MVVGAAGEHLGDDVTQRREHLVPGGVEQRPVEEGVGDEVGLEVAGRRVHDHVGDRRSQDPVLDGVCALGREGGGFVHLMENLPQERLSIAVGAVAGAEAVFALTLQHCKERTAFGQPIGSFQANRFTLAELVTTAEVTQAFVDACVMEQVHGRLTAVDAAKAKWWTAQVQNDILDACVQLWGGYGYMKEYEIERSYRDVRLNRIGAGTDEIMLDVIGRSYGL